jgi:gliding motility-associated-like protein
MKRIFFLLLLLAANLFSFAQDFSNKGKDFWVGYGNHVRMFNAGGREQMQIYITSDVNTIGNVSINSIGFSQDYTVTANQITVVDIPASAALMDDGLYNHGIHITAEKPVVTYGFIYVSNISGATLFLPTNTLGKNYYSLNFAQISNEPNSYSYFFVCAADTGTTTVELTPSQATKGGFPAGVTQTITLTQGQIYQVLSNSDLTGSTIKSVAGTDGVACKKIAVFCGSGKISIGCTGNPGSSDNLYQQMYPASSWGKKYILVPSVNNPNGSLRGNNNYFRIFSPDPSAVVKLDNNIVPLASFSNSYYQFSSNTPRMVESDKPILVAQYFTSQNDNCGSGNLQPHDPDMIYLNPVEQTVSNVTLNSMQPSSGTNIDQHFINVVLKSAGTGVSSFQIDGAQPPVAASVLSWDNGYSYMQFQVSQGAHNLSCDSGFNAIAYGFGNHESYGYSAGANLRDLYNFVEALNPLNISGTNSACACTPFYYTITYPFQPLSLYWDFKGFQTPNVTVSSPVADSTYFINGKQVWRYKLPGQYNYCPAGNYPISVTAGTAGSDGCGNTQIKEDTLFVRAVPLPDFNWIHNGCLSDSVHFNDITVYDENVYSYKWLWDFGDGTTSTDEHNPVHKYNAPGTYTVSYSLVTNIGCESEIKTKQITISGVPVAKFGISSPLCINMPVTISDSSVVPAPGTIQYWYWDFGDGLKDTTLNNANLLHAYTTAGQRTVTLQIASAGGCLSAPFDKTFVINPSPVVDFTMPAKVCLPYDLANFTDASTISDDTEAGFSWKWHFGEPSSGANDSSAIKNPTHLYSVAGPFNVKLIVTSLAGCSDSTTKVLSNVFAKASANFTVNTENCLNTVTSFASNSNGQGNNITAWSWDFGDVTTGAGQTITHTYATANTFQVKHWILTDKGCYSDTITKPVTVNPLPKANFTIGALACEKNNLTITDASTAGAGNITAWTWNFGIAGNDSVINNNLPFNYKYDTAKNYSITLSLLTDKGCKTATAFSKTVVVNPLPQPGFISPEVCLTDASAQFIDTSSIAAGTITGWNWNFGDPGSGVNNTFNGLNGQHRYNAIGLYTATLTVTSNAGCKDSASQSFTVNGDIPKANFLPQAAANLCANDSIVIKDSSTVNFGNVTKVEIYWDIVGSPSQKEVDDLPAYGKIYKNQYLNFQNPLTKDYFVRYKAYSGASCVDSVTKKITVHAAPKVQFVNVAPVCLDAVSYQLTEATEVGGVPGPPGGVFSGPGISATGLFTPSITGVGTFSILYTYTSAFGCVDTISNTIKVLSPAVANFGFSKPGCEKNSISFTDSSSIPSGSGTISNWNWNFGDGTPAVNNNTNAAVSHTYAVRNTYTVTLTITSSNGCKVSKQQQVTVSPLPVPSFTFPASACLPNASITFTDVSTIADGTMNTFTYAWRFGDPSSGNNSATSKNPMHVFATTGPYAVTLTCTSGAGCKDSVTLTVNTIHPQPAASFTSDSASICETQTVQFTDNSTGADGTVNKWLWNFDNGSSSSLQVPPSQTYNTAKQYSIELEVENSFGCKDTATKPFAVYANPVISAGPDRVLLEGGEITLAATATGNGLKYFWNADRPGNYLNSNIVLQPTVKGITEDINYTLTVVAAGGCWQQDVVLVELLKAPVVPNTFSPNGDGINENWTIQYLESYPDCKIQVFNRDGQPVYETHGYSTPGWDGRYKGQVLPFGTYYYVIEPGSGRKPITGYVTIVY